MTIKDFLKITCEDIYAFDIESEKISEDKEVMVLSFYLFLQMIKSLRSFG